MSEAEGYIALMREQFEELGTSLSGLSAEALNWQPPAPGSNTIYAIATHTLGGAAFWIQQVVGGINIGRDRDAEFRAAGADLEQWMAQLGAVRDGNEKILRAMSSREFDLMRDTGRGTVTARWCVLHVIDHTSRHIGHIELTRQLWERAAGTKR